MKILTIEYFKNSQIKYFFSFSLLSSAVLFFLIDQPDLGQSFLLILSWIATVFISGVSLFYISFFAFFLIFISSLLFLMPEKFGYIINGLITFVDPQKETSFNHLPHLMQ